MKLPGRLIRGPVRPDANSLRRFASLRWAALPIVDRRWTAPMSAVALGFGLFVGVAIGPGTEGSLGTTNPVVVKVPAPDDTTTAQVPSDDLSGIGTDLGGPPNGNGNGDRNENGGSGSPFDSSPPPLDTPPSTPPIDSFPSTPPPVTTTPPPVTTPPAEPTEPVEPVEPAEPEPTALTGTVVHWNSEARSYSIALDDGSLAAIHSHEPPTVGRRVKVEVEQLANGTYVEHRKPRVSELRSRATFTGTVTFQDPVTGIYTVSRPGVSVLVRGGQMHNPPDVGENVEVKAKIVDKPEELPVSEPGAEGCGVAPKPPRPPETTLEQVAVGRADIEEDGKAPASDAIDTADIEGVVEGVCRDSRKLIVSADDIRESGHDISIAIPKDLKVAPLKPGQVLKLTVSIGISGAFTLTTVAGDQGRDGADDPELVQP